MYVLVGSGGFHQGERARQADFLTPYLSHALNTLGLFNLQFIYLQGLVFGDASVCAAVAQARATLSQDPLFAELVLV